MLNVSRNKPERKGLWINQDDFDAINFILTNSDQSHQANQFDTREIAFIYTTATNLTMENPERKYNCSVQFY